MVPGAVVLMGSPTGAQTVPLKTRFSDGASSHCCLEGMREGRQCFRAGTGPSSPALLTAPPPQANEGSTDFYTGLEVPHQLPAAVLLTPRPTLHLLRPRPGCILRHSWTSLALSHRTPALGIQTCRSLTSKPVATPECPSRLANTVMSCNKCPLRTSSSPRLGQLTW